MGAHLHFIEKAFAPTPSAIGRKERGCLFAPKYSSQKRNHASASVDSDLLEPCNVLLVDAG